MAELVDAAMLAQFPPEAHPEIIGIAEAAAIAARETFGPFNDEDESPFYEAEGMSPTATWEALAERVASTCAYAILLALAEAPATLKLITDLHARIFGEAFPEAGGELRRGDEEIQYSIVLGTREAPVHRAVVGTTPKNVRDRLQRACDAFNEAVAREDASDSPAPLERLVAPAVTLYCKVLSIHPFRDGNGRLAYVLLQFALVRNYLVGVALDDFAEHQWALGVALRRDGQQSYLEMERLVADRIKEARF